MKLRHRKRTKVTITAFAASILAGALSSAAMAQMAQNPVSNFDYGYLDEHPKVAQQLSADPGLVDNPQFMANHPGLQQYFANHPEVRMDIKQHPDAFMSRENQFNAYHGTNPPPGGNWNNGYQAAVGRLTGVSRRASGGRPTTSGESVAGR